LRKRQAYTLEKNLQTALQSTASSMTEGLERLMSIAKLRLLVLLLIASFALVACDMAASPEEDSNFEGPPIVRIAAPLAGDTYREGVSVDILIRVENAGADIARVAIQVDGEIVGESSLPNSEGQASFTVQLGWTALGVGPHTVGAVASRADTTVSEPASVTINVVAAPQSATSTQSNVVQATATTESNAGFTQPTQQENSNQQPQATNTEAQAPTVASTNTSAPAPATATPSRPMVNVTTGANIRSGPSQAFNPPIGSLAVGATAPILAVNTDGTWYKIQYYNGTGWIFSSTVSVTGDISGLPREAGPPTPVPATPVPTAVPVTQAPPSTVDLIIDGANTSISPAPFRCGRSSEIKVTVVNAGTTTSAATNVLVQDIEPNGNIGATTQGPVPALAPNQSALVVMYLTVNTYVGQGHTFRATADGNGSVPETNENNNRNEYVYVLASSNQC
jgi:uncharacterized protein YraI